MIHIHRPWHEDDRPVWRVTCVYEGHAEFGAIVALDLRDQLAATGKVRHPEVFIRDGECRVTLMVRSSDDAQAGADALTLIDSAARHVAGLELGEPTAVPLTSRAGSLRPFVTAGPR